MPSDKTRGRNSPINSPQVYASSSGTGDSSFRGTEGLKVIFSCCHITQDRDLFEHLVNGGESLILISSALCIIMEQ